MPQTLRDGGVSEVIGTLLVLAMTVVLFGAVIIWVASIPTPQASIRLDMDGRLHPVYDDAGTWAGANITIVHRGGEALPIYRTLISLTVVRDGLVTGERLQTRGTSFGFPYGIDGPDDTWQAGEQWRYTNYSFRRDDRITVTVIDTIRSIILWNEPLLGPEGLHPPLFLEKWADRNPDTPSIDVPQTNRQFTILARVTDPDGDLNRASVHVYLAFLHGSPEHRPPVRMYDDGTNGDAVRNDGVFTAQYAFFRPSSRSWDGGIVIFNATDLAEHATTSRMVLEVVDGPPGSGRAPFGGTWNATLGGIGQGDSGPLGDYGYNVFNETGLPTPENPSGSPTRVFRRGESVYVVARSTVIKNLENINAFVLRDSLGAKLYPQTREFDSRDPTRISPAFEMVLTSPWFEFRYRFDTANLPLGLYPFEFTLKDNAGNAPFFATDRVWVTGDGRTVTAHPRLTAWRDPNRDGVLSDLVPEFRFKSTEKVYVRFFVRDKDVALAYVNAHAGDVEIQDYFGFFPVKRRPGIAPVSPVASHTSDRPGESTYVFSIDLLRRNQDPWVAGSNWYTLRVRTLSDEGVPGTAERYQMLAMQIVIDAPLSTIDIVGATEGTTAGNSRGVYWYQNTFYWIERPVEILPKEAKKPLAMATGDLNGDTKVDVVVGLDAKEVTNIVAYYNLDYGSTWRREFVNQFEKADRYRAESLAIGDLDGDGDAEIVAGIRSDAGAGVGVIVFWNDGSWSPQLLRYSEPGVAPNMRSVAIGDVNNDGRPDVVAGDSNGVVTYYCNNVRGSFLPGATLPCPSRASLEPPNHPDSFERGVRVGKAAPILFNSLRLGRMEGVSGDLDPSAPGADQTLDVVVSNDKDLILYRNRLIGGSPMFTRFDLRPGTYTGNPVDRAVQSVAVGDMNNDNMLDIVIGIDPAARAGGVYRLRNAGMTGPPIVTFLPWESRLLPHPTVDPKDGKVADLGKIKDLALGDTDGDGDLDIVFISDQDSDFLNNMWFLENVGDEPSTYAEANIFTDGWFKRREKAFAVELGYVDL